MRNFRPLKDKVVVSEIDEGEKITKAGLIIPDDDGKERGIRKRWAKIWAIGDDIDDLKVGEWVLVSHGRWTRGVKVDDEEGNELTIRMIDYPDSILVISPFEPSY